MKLDKDLVRQILLSVEASNDAPVGWITLEIEGRSSDELSYHVMLLAEAGFIEAQDLSTLGEFEWQPTRLTYQGHEFLDTIRDSEVWRRTKAGAEKAGVASVGFVWDLAKAYGKQVLSERLGITPA